MTFEEKIIANELYTCIQGEGLYAGTPSILIRFTGCKLRCQFNGGNLCDSYHSSWKPERASISYQSLSQMIESNPQITHLIISGGGPTSHKTGLPKLCKWIKNNYSYLKITLETEGSEFVEDCFIDVLSLSPKLKNSIPVQGFFSSELNRTITARDVEQHEKYRTNYKAMSEWIEQTRSKEFYLKFVICKDQIQEQLEEVEYVRDLLNVPFLNTFLMPEGITSTQLDSLRRELFVKCIEKGYRYSDRLHILAYGDQRFV